MKDSIKTPLLEKLNKCSAQDPSRQGGVYCIPILDKENGVTVTLVFVSNFRPEKVNEISFTEITKPDKRGGEPICIGGVIILPSFWLDPALKGLTPYYLENIIDEIYTKHRWDNGNGYYDGSYNTDPQNGCSNHNTSNDPLGSPFPMPNPIRAIGI